ncbi:MAG: serine protease, partial [Flavobacteriales bacterium]|nr:serine protease [Flavobacteriales bacterium]
MKRNLLVLIGYIISIVSFAQQEDAWVYLTDKQNATYSTNNPIDFLTQKAIDRKNAHGVVIDERDFPVNENYISQLKLQPGITVLAKSKWFNAVHVRGMEIAINALSMLSFVASIDFANKSLNTLKRDFVKKQSKIEEVSVSFNYGDAFNQIEMIKGEQLHLSDYTGNGVTIAVLDGGFTNVNTMLSFKRLRDAGHLLGEHDFVDNDEDVYSNTTTDHGTWVLSTMAGYLENQYVGTAPDASY